VALAVQREVEARITETDALRRKHVERAQYEAELARRRYMMVDPDNRLVAESLEAEWNDKLRSLAEAQQQYEQQTQKQRLLVDSQASSCSRWRPTSRESGMILQVNLENESEFFVSSSKT
jgi:hypothetical protein